MVGLNTIEPCVSKFLKPILDSTVMKGHIYLVWLVKRLDPIKQVRWLLQRLSMLRYMEILRATSIIGRAKHQHEVEYHRSFGLSIF